MPGASRSPCRGLGQNYSSRFCADRVATSRQQLPNARSCVPTRFWACAWPFAVPKRSKRHETRGTWIDRAGHAVAARGRVKSGGASRYGGLRVRAADPDDKPGIAAILSVRPAWIIGFMVNWCHHPYAVPGSQSTISRNDQAPRSSPYRRAMSAKIAVTRL